MWFDFIFLIDKMKNQSHDFEMNIWNETISNSTNLTSAVPPIHLINDARGASLTQDHFGVVVVVVGVAQDAKQGGGLRDEGEIEKKE